MDAGQRPLSACATCAHCHAIGLGDARTLSAQGLMYPDSYATRLFVRLAVCDALMGLGEDFIIRCPANGERRADGTRDLAPCGDELWEPAMGRGDDE